MNKRHLTASAVLASALVLTACGGGSGSDTAAGNAGGSTSSPSAETATSNAADLAFLTGMKPHHEQAVKMSEMVLAADPPPEVAAIAKQIEGAQGPEIKQMTTMLGALGQEVDGQAHSGGQSMGMAGHEGMMSDQMMADLDGATGTEAARLYLEGMIRHHQGAIEASEAELVDGAYPPALKLADEIKQAQGAEITTMQALLASL